MPDLSVHQYPVTGRLGRHHVLDPRSLAYVRPYAGQPLTTAEWEPKIPVLDQQDLLAQGIDTDTLFPGVGTVDALGSCTGNAGTAVVSALLTKDEATAAGLDTDDPVAAEEWAIRLYADATRADTWHGHQWPKEDCGSSGLGVAKVLKARGLADQYGHATTAEQFAVLLQYGMVLMGMPWPRAFFEPTTKTAVLDAIPGWQDSPIDGGHEVAVTALEAITFTRAGRLDTARTILRVRNSWSKSWGDDGCFRMSLALYEALRSQIDLIQPRRDPGRA
ncbi:hypothetical protein ABZ829_27950 [Streptomyces xanthochromogenes]|uniref:hypothetical protein n=1 Tax=Streptomyces xanthochromogenes TaxID=67384 RepID=UPI003433070B